MIQRYLCYIAYRCDEAIVEHDIDDDGDWYKQDDVEKELSSLKAEREIEEDKKAALREEVVSLRHELSIVTDERDALKDEVKP